MTNNDEAKLTLERLKQQRLQEKRNARAEVFALTFAGAMGGGFVFVMLEAAVDYPLGDNALSEVLDGIGGRSFATLVCGAWVVGMEGGVDG